MKGNNEFAYFLAVGLILLAIFMLIFNVNVLPGKEKQVIRGPEIVQAVKTFSIPDIAASNVLETRTTELVKKDVFNGLLFGEDKIVYDLSKSDLQDIHVRFNVIDTNRLGKLDVRVNNKVAESRMFEPGQHIINIDNSMIADRMLIELAAESSLWRIWAPNIYHVDNAALVYTSFSEDFSQFRFYLGEELNTLDFAKLDMTLRQNTGTLRIELNGRTIWDSPVSDLQAVVLEKSDLRLGDNTIKFHAAEDSRFFGAGNIVVIFTTALPVPNQTGVITAVQMLQGSSNRYG